MTPAQVKGMYLRQIGKKGETVTLRRTGIADMSVRAFVTDNYPVVSPNDVVQEGRRVAIVLADDVANVSFPLPFLERKDRVIWGGGANNDVIQKIAARRVGGVVIAYELELEGM